MWSRLSVMHWVVFENRNSYCTRIFLLSRFHTNREVMNMINKINNDELPIGFTMELAMHSDALNRFAGLSKPEQERIVDGARTIESRQEMRNYVENMFTKG